MPRIVKPLSALEVSRIAHPQGKASHHLHPVGTVPGLYLQTTAGGGRSWVLRVQIGAKRREMGLGAYPRVTVAEAWEKARNTVRLIRDEKRDPIAERRAKDAAFIAEQLRNLTFAQAVERYMRSGRMAKLRHDWQRDEWRNTLDAYAGPELGKMLVEDVTLADVKRVLIPIWNDKHATATKVRGRVEAVLAWAIDAGHRENVTNPATKSALAQWIKDQGAASVTNRPAVPVERMAEWFAAVEAQGGMAAKALRFLALTAVRVDNVLGMTWAEVDSDARLWIIPASRMKGKADDRREHRVPLSDASLALLDSLERRDGVALVFPAARDGELSNAAIGKAMRTVHDKADGGFIDARSGLPAVPHGLRSSFRTWAADVGEYDPEMAEIALAHKVGSKVQQAYNRSAMIERRRAMMQAWADWCLGQSAASDNVVSIRGAA